MGYAALTGHTHLVEVFLSLYLMCSVVITKSNLNASLSFKEWFDKLGTRSMCLGKKFSKAEYDVCVLNALSEDVRHVMTKKKITMEHAIDVVKVSIDPLVNESPHHLSHKTPWKSIVDKMQDLKKKMNQLKGLELESSRRLNKTRKPMLVCEGLFDVDDYRLNSIHEDEHYYYSDEYVEDNEEKEEDVPALTAQVDSSDEYFTIEQHEQQLEELEELVSYIRQNDDFSIVSNDGNDDDTFNSSNYSLLIENDVPALTLEGEVISYDEEEVEEAPSVPEDSWDVVSEVESVNSVTSSITKLSYKEILMEKPSAPKENEKSVNLKDLKQITPTSNHTQKSSSLAHNDNASSPSSPKSDNRTDDNDTPNVFTCEDERDGIKLARGGKQSRMFKAEGKTQRQYYWAGDKSRCRRTRNRKGAKIGQISHCKYW